MWSKDMCLYCRFIESTYKLWEIDMKFLLEKAFGICYSVNLLKADYLDF